MEFELIEAGLFDSSTLLLLLASGAIFAGYELIQRLRGHRSTITGFIWHRNQSSN